jgi:EAL domain-containing protein (putative c-di-GMP-specific phosphodiesterase class I)
VHSAGPGRPARISASIGVSAFTADGALAADDIIAEADIAMYDAKEAGRAGIRVFRAEEHRRERMTVRAQWITRLREALERDRFRLYAQPISGICSNGVQRAELLLRYLDDDGSLVAPGHFLYLAERYDLMRDIDRWVIGQAIELLDREHAAGRDVALSVNVSGRTLTDAHIGDELAALLAGRRFPAGRLIIEVTETAAITNLERARAFADRLHELGCRFSLDDFGSGFASFYYLKHLRFDEIKIDGEFVRRLPDTPVDELVIEAVVGIARGLGTKTVAEFVSSDETVAILRRLGVDYGQGLHLAPPVPVETLFPLTGDVGVDVR